MGRYECGKRIIREWEPNHNFAAEKLRGGMPLTPHFLSHVPGRLLSLPFSLHWFQTTNNIWIVINHQFIYKFFYFFITHKGRFLKNWKKDWNSIHYFVLQVWSNFQSWSSKWRRFAKTISDWLGMNLLLDRQNPIGGSHWPREKTNSICSGFDFSSRKGFLVRIENIKI